MAEIGKRINIPRPNPLDPKVGVNRAPGAPETVEERKQADQLGAVAYIELPADTERRLSQPSSMQKTVLATGMMALVVTMQIEALQAEQIIIASKLSKLHELMDKLEARGHHEDKKHVEEKLESGLSQQQQELLDLMDQYNSLQKQIDTLQTQHNSVVANFKQFLAKASKVLDSINIFATQSLDDFPQSKVVQNNADLNTFLSKNTPGGPTTWEAAHQLAQERRAADRPSAQEMFERSVRSYQEDLPEEQQLFTQEELDATRGYALAREKSAEDQHVLALKTVDPNANLDQLTSAGEAMTAQIEAEMMATPEAHASIPIAALHSEIKSKAQTFYSDATKIKEDVGDLEEKQGKVSENISALKTTLTGDATRTMKRDAEEDKAATHESTPLPGTIPTPKPNIPT